MQRSVMYLLILWFEIPSALSPTIVLLARLSCICSSVQYSSAVLLQQVDMTLVRGACMLLHVIFIYIWLESGHLTWFSSQDSVVISSQGVGKKSTSLSQLRTNSPLLLANFSLHCKLQVRPCQGSGAWSPEKLFFCFH